MINNRKEAEYVIYQALMSHIDDKTTKKYYAHELLENLNDFSDEATKDDEENKYMTSEDINEQFVPQENLGEYDIRRKGLDGALELLLHNWDDGADPDVAYYFSSIINPVEVAKQVSYFRIEYVYFDLLGEVDFNDDTILTKNNIKKLLDLISGQTVSYSIDIIDNQDIVIDNITSTNAFNPLIKKAQFIVENYSHKYPEIKHEFEIITSQDLADNPDIDLDSIKLPILKDIFEKGNLKLEIRKHAFGRKFTGSKEDN